MNLNVSKNLDEFNYSLPLTPSYVKMILNDTSNLNKQNLIDTLLGTDSDYTAKILERNSIFRKAEWSIEETGNKKIDDFVREELWRVLDNNIFQQIHESVFRRFSVQEIVWSKSSQVRIEALINHSQRGFEYEDGVLKLYNKEENKFSSIPDNKIILCESPLKIKNYPLSISEQLAMIICIKYYALYKNWPKFNENYAMPPVVGKTGTNNEEEKKVMRKGLEDLGSFAYAVISNDSSIDFLELKYSSPETFEKIIKVSNDVIAKAVLAQTLTTQSDGKGSYSLGEVHADVKEDVFTESLDLVCDSINKYLVKPLVDFNFTTDIYPRFKLMLPESFNKKISRDNNLTRLGVRFKKDYFVESYGLNPDHFEVSEPVVDNEGDPEQKKTLNFRSSPFI